MKLFEFLEAHQEALVARCVEHMKEEIPSTLVGEADDHFRGFVREVIRALREHQRLPAPDALTSAPPLDAAHDAFDRGLAARALVPTYTLLSVAVGELGAKENASFPADEYLVFNQVIDKHVALAIEEMGVASGMVTNRHLGFLAHELRNALSSALMAFRILERGDVPLNGRTADVLRRNLVRMERVIEDALTATSLEGAQVPLLHEIDLDAMLREVEGSAVLERGIRIVIDESAGLCVIADERLLQSTLSNLLQNAVKFSRDEATIRLRAAPEDAMVRIDVEDECGGLPAGKTEELFQPFVRGARTRRGVGLGLAIAREAMRLLGGTITVRDNPGQGCVFAIRLARGRTPRA